MQYLATIVLVQDGEEVKPLAISSGDDVWYVSADDANPDLKKIQAEIEKGGNQTVLGHICIADHWRK